MRSCLPRRLRRVRGEHAVDLGAGVGAAGLALARRVEGLAVTLVEIDPALSALGRDNAERNGLAVARARGLSRCRGDRRGFCRGRTAGGVGRSRADEPAVQCGAKSVAGSRRAAWRAPHRDDTLAQWLGTAARLLRASGTVTLIWRADGLGEVLRGADGRVRRGRGSADSPKARCTGDPRPGARRKGRQRTARAVAGLRARRCRRQAEQTSRSGAARRRDAELERYLMLDWRR